MKLAVDALCRRDANLLTAEAALKLMIRKLHSLDFSVRRDLATALSARIHQRRTQLPGVLQCLHNPQTVTELNSEEEEDNLFAIPAI